MIYQEDGRWLVRGPMGWPAMLKTGKDEYLGWVDMGFWVRPATEEEISTMDKGEQ